MAAYKLFSSVANELNFSTTTTEKHSADGSGQSGSWTWGLRIASLVLRRLKLMNIGT